ncbi:MAG: pyridoxal-phosphate dependent enzyme, partial [Rhodothermales bacterium]|nr:pyridoxal-phosphate dependent enzyme [Rhodothermales bacterium]
DRIETIADGIGVRTPIQEAVEDMQGWVDDAILVQEESIIQAMRLVHRHAGLVAEPSAVVGIAALIEHQLAFAHARVATVLCGGNLTDEQVARWLCG